MSLEQTFRQMEREYQELRRLDEDLRRTVHMHDRTKQNGGGKSFIPDIQRAALGDIAAQAMVAGVLMQWLFDQSYSRIFVKGALGYPERPRDLHLSFPRPISELYAFAIQEWLYATNAQAQSKSKSEVSK